MVRKEHTKMSVVSNKSIVKKSNVIKDPFSDKVLYVTSNVVLGLFSLIVLLLLCPRS